MKKIKQNFIKWYVIIGSIAVTALYITLGFMAAFSSKCNAYELGIKYGLETTDQVTAKEVKFVSLEYQNDIAFIFRHKLAAGAWFDQNTDLNQSSSNFVAYSMGIKVEPGIFYLENLFGISLISRTDALLSTNFEFTEELGVGVQDEYGRYIGASFKHFSNAGIQLPNIGRNFILISTGVRL